MEIVSIEKKTFEMMVASFNALSEKVAALRRKSDGRFFMQFCNVIYN